MKKLLLFIFVSIVYCCAFSQDDNYFKLQYSNPVGEYKCSYNQGFGLEFGRRFMFNLAIGDLVVPGIDVSFLNISFNKGKEESFFVKSINSSADSLAYFADDGFIMLLGPKIGFVSSLELIDGLMLDLSLKYLPTIIITSRTLGKTPDDIDTYGESSTGLSFANCVSIEPGIRYKWFSFGMEFVLGKVNVNYGKNIIPHIENGTYSLIKKKTLGINTFKLFVGINF